MEVNQGAEILLKAVHDDINGTIIFSDFLQHQTEGYDDRTAAEITGIYNKALLVLIDEGLCHRGTNANIIELGQKGIDCKGDFKKYRKKKQTSVFLDKARRIAPILSFIIVLVTFVFGFLKKTNTAKKEKVKTEMKRDSIMRAKSRR